jgi:thiamine-phosphate pyrophosphorylase
MLNHRGPEFRELITRVTERMQRAFRTRNDLLTLAASGTGGMEAAVVNHLSAADPVLAAASGAHGVHWPNRMLACARRWRTRRPDWVVTASAHSVREIARAEGLADAAFLSPVFASASSSATRPLGPLRAGRIAQDAPMPVLALGGVNTRTVRRLQGLGFSGAGAVDALA